MSRYGEASNEPSTSRIVGSISSQLCPEHMRPDSPVDAFPSNSHPLSSSFIHSDTHRDHSPLPGPCTRTCTLLVTASIAPSLCTAPRLLRSILVVPIHHGMPSARPMRGKARMTESRSHVGGLAWRVAAVDIGMGVGSRKREEADGRWLMLTAHSGLFTLSIEHLCHSSVEFIAMFTCLSVPLATIHRNHVRPIRHHQRTRRDTLPARLYRWPRPRSASRSLRRQGTRSGKVFRVVGRARLSRGTGAALAAVGECARGCREEDIS